MGDLMNSLIYFFWGLVLLIDAVFLICSSYYYLFLLVLPFLCFKKVHSLSKTEIDEQSITGFSIGRGLDLSDPSEPKQVSIILDDAALDLGALFMGSPGSGKSVAASALKQYFTISRPNSGYAFFEGKGDFDIYQSDVAAGSKPDFFFSSELDSSDTINLISGNDSNVIDYLSKVLVGSESEYYGAAQTSAIRKTIPLLMSLDIPVNLKDFWALLTDDNAALYLINKAEENEVDSDIIEIARTYFGFNLDEPKDFSSHKKERLKVIDGLLNKLYPFVSGKLAERLNDYNPTLNLNDAIQNNKKLYFHLPLSETAVSIATIITEQFGAIAKYRQLETNSEFNIFPLMFDDWGAFFYDNFLPITARCRSAKMPIYFYFQSRGQTDDVKTGGIFTTEITDNIGAFISLRINGIDSSKWVSSQFGEYESYSLSKSENNHSSGQNVQAIDKPKVRPEELRDLNKGEAFINIFVSGAGGAMSARSYKGRFPLPKQIDEKPKSWPVVALNDKGEGLDLWGKFMKKENVNDLKNQIINDAQLSALDNDNDNGVDFL